MYPYIFIYVICVFQTIPENLSWIQQKNLMDCTFNCALNKQFPIKLSYQINFLKRLIAHLEKTCTEVHDEVYETFCKIQQNLIKDTTEKFAYKHYVLKSDIHFTLRESKSFVADGTTGLCSWQASLALADFLINNPSITRDKSVLELGAGTGLCGFIMLKICKPRHLLLSDGSTSCVELMCESIRRNFCNVVEENNIFKVDSQIVECVVVPWESIEEIEKISNLKPDIIMAADVVYDDSCFNDLSSAIDYIFKLKRNNVEMYLAATVRNEHTLNSFLKILCKCSFIFHAYVRLKF